MNWAILAAVAIAGTLGSLTDWLFMGILFHAHYNTYPEVWWPEVRSGKDRKGILWSTVLGYVSTAAIIASCALAGVHGIVPAVVLAALAWLAGPFLVLIVNGFFIRIDPRVTVAHCGGYLARFLIAGAAAGVVLG